MSQGSFNVSMNISTEGARKGLHIGVLNEGAED